MGRDRGPVGKLSRNLGVNLVETAKIDNLMKKRPYPSGQHGQARKKKSEFAVQLQEKQRLKLRFGIREGQLRKYYETASRKKGNTGTLLLQLLEQRLDNLVYRAGFAATRRQARQMVSHGHVILNGRRTDVPSALCRLGDVIVVREKSLGWIKTTLEANAMKNDPSPWLTVDSENLSIRFERLPERTDLDATIKEQLIIEYYSR